MKVRKTRFLAGATVALVGALSITACSSGGGASPSASSGGKLSGTITIPAVHELTGSAGFAGSSTQNGIDLALEEINSSGVLGDGVTLKVETMDTASNTETATANMSKALSDASAPLVLGPLISTAAQAVAPLAERSKKAVIMGQAGGPGVIVSDYVYRITAAEDSFYQLLFDYAKDQGVKTIDIIYDTGSSRFVYNAQTLGPDFAKKNDMKIGSTSGAPTGASDFTAIASKITGENPDAVMFFNSGTSEVTAVKQLRQAGYTGILLANQSLGASLATAGAAADGAVWAAPYSPAATEPESMAKFTAAFQAKYNKPADVYAADGYDQIYLVADALKKAGSTDPAAVQAALQEVTKGSIDGAQGKITFKKNDAQAAGILLQAKDGKAVVITP
jgi:branched-chain amino acid transport system substrate-binding protein